MPLEEPDPQHLYLSDEYEEKEEADEEEEEETTAEPTTPSSHSMSLPSPQNQASNTYQITVNQ